MWLPPARLIKHTLAGAVLFGSLLVSPVLLLFRKQLGQFAVVLGLALLAIGVSSFSAAAVTRLLLGSGCAKWQRWLVLLAGQVFSPLNVAIVGAAYSETLVRLSCAPLAAALVLALGRVPLCQGDGPPPDDVCSVNTLTNWICSRTAALGLPLLLLSVQVGLYAPRSALGDLGVLAGLFVGGGVMLMSAKLFLVCSVLDHEQGRQRLGLAAALATMLSADSIGAFQLLRPKVISDERKAGVLAVHLLVAGVVLFRIAWRRLRLCDRWRRALAERSARQVRLASPDLELNSDLVASAGCAGRGESSDSDDELGPGSLPHGYHDSFLCLLLAMQLPQAPREFLLAPRVVQVPPQPPLTSAATPAQPAAGSRPQDSEPTAAATPQASGSGEAPPLSMAGAADKRCTICLLDIEDGESVRPLPKCSHVFHVACLDSWAVQQKEKTDCPNCRRPALARKSVDGATSYKDLCPPPRASERPAPASAASGSAPRDRLRAQLAAPRRSVQAVSNSLGVSRELAAAALQVRRGNPDEAVNLLIEWAALVRALPRQEADPRFLPMGAVQGVIEAFPALDDSVAEVAVFLLRWQRQTTPPGGRLRPPWSELGPEQRQAAFRSMLDSCSGHPHA